jgi:hypothetical protein
MGLRLPQGNTLVLAILRSRLHRPLSGMALELRYTGRRSGRTYTLPVQYARAGDRLVLWPQDAERKRWWRNFREPQEVELLLAGEERRGTAHVVDRGGSQWDEVRSAYAARWRRFGEHLTGPFVVISLHPDGDERR